jgi:hypothetical protein
MGFDGRSPECSGCANAAVIRTLRRWISIIRKSKRPRNFTVTATDRSGDTFSEVRLYRNGILIAVNQVSGNSINTSFTDDATIGEAYYYVIVKENDDQDGNGRNDEALSSSIWIK